MRATVKNQLHSEVHIVNRVLYHISCSIVTTSLPTSRTLQYKKPS